MGVNYNPRVVTDGLVLALDAGNPKSYNYNIVTYSQDFQNAAYSKSTGLIAATGVLAPDSTLTATTMTDDDAANWESFGRSFTVPNDSTLYNISIYIRKTTGATSTRTGFNVSLTGGTTKSYNIRFNADTGVAAGGDSNLVTSENNNFWRLSFTVSNNSTGNTSLNISYYPATGIYDGGDVTTATGSHTIWGFQVTKGAALLPYRVNVNTPDTTWYDLSGNNNNGTLTNGPFFDINNRGMITFDGSNDYINLGNVLNIPRASVTVAFKLDSLSTRPHIIGKGAGVTGWIYLVGEVNGVFNSYYDIGSGWTSINGGSFNINTWYIITFTYDGTSAKVYVNGNLINTATNAGNLRTDDTNNFYIGAGPGISQFVDGFIPFSLIYNRALYDSEIQQNFNATRGRFGI